MWLSEHLWNFSNANLLYFPFFVVRAAQTRRPKDAIGEDEASESTILALFLKIVKLYLESGFLFLEK